MPTYEFRCPVGHDFERFYGKISDAPSEVACPECGQVAERRISAGAGLLFKGSGFYITDYGKDGKKDLKAAPKAGEGSGGEKGAAPSAEKGGEKGSTASGGAASGGTGGAASSAPSTPAPSTPPKKAGGE